MQLSGARARSGAPDYVPFCRRHVAVIAFSRRFSARRLDPDNSALIGKVALPRELLVLAPCAASFLLHGAGFLAILVVLFISGQGIEIARIPLALLLYVPLFAYALGICLTLAALQVFVRDLVQIIGQLLTLMMFAAPIFYDRTNLPERFQILLDLNPFTFYVEGMRNLLLGYGESRGMM